MRAHLFSVNEKKEVRKLNQKSKPIFPECRRFRKQRNERRGEAEFVCQIDLLLLNKTEPLAQGGMISLRNHDGRSESGIHKKKRKDDGGWAGLPST
jgi:hypothetical protein